MKVCSVEGCENKYHSGGYCNKHRQQMQLYGCILERTRFDPNEFIFEDAVCKIQIYDQSNNPKCQAIIDVEDYEKVKDYKWSIGRKNIVQNKSVGLLSRFILDQVNLDIQIDHINHDRLDNRKCNLRPCTQANNLKNVKKKSNNTSGYKGAYWHKRIKKWGASIGVNNSLIYLGYFDTKEEAALAYNEAAKKYHGEFAYLNDVKGQ